MKKLVIILGIGIAGLAFSPKQADAQISLSVNIGSQPLWGPVGYDHVEYYYLPDIESYYYVPRHQFVYLSNGRWVFSASLPARYRNYNLERGYKVVINEPRAYEHYKYHEEKYGRYSHHDHDQKLIRYSDDPRYNERRGNSQNHENRGHEDHGNHKDNGHHGHDD
ncbi:MAG: hypothetical protein IE931_13395 [Sphingobacteriales bacterium]|nr:hypothetical protein [Sphingobacteriales bacterium]